MSSLSQQELRWLSEGLSILYPEATDYTLNRIYVLKTFLFNGRIEINDNPAKNVIQPNVIGRKN